MTIVGQGSDNRERSEAEDKVKRYKKQASDDRKKISEMEMMSETVGGRKRMLVLLQAAREDAANTVVAIAKKLALRYPRK